MSVISYCKDCNFLRKQDGNRAFCNFCYKIRRSDIIETVEVVDNKVIYRAFDDKLEAEEKLKTLTADIRYDLHGVLDTVDKSVYLSDIPSCALSFVGATTKTRLGARKEIIERIFSNQIKFGILVFKRGRGNIKYKFTDPGSKAWANTYIQRNGNKSYFIDDSDDHFYSVKSLNLPGLECFLKKTTTPLKSIVDSF